jgi:hypothetical protein
MGWDGTGREWCEKKTTCCDPAASLLHNHRPEMANPARIAVLPCSYLRVFKAKFGGWNVLFPLNQHFRLGSDQLGSGWTPSVQRVEGPRVRNGETSCKTSCRINTVSG